MTSQQTRRTPFVCVGLLVAMLQLVGFANSVSANDPDCNLCEEKPIPRGNVCFGNFSSTNYKPWCPSMMHVQFYLYTRHSKHSAQMIQAYDDSLDSSQYNATKPTTLFSHGFKGRGPDKKSRLLKNALLNQEDMNVILVNWRKGANPGTYLQAAANTISVGVMVGQLIATMNLGQGDGYDRIHCVGYSLGAHVCGFAGKEVRRVTSSRMGRITGLDPAGPEFESNPVDFRLDKSDAIFVDTIHTDAQPGGGGWGIQKAIGHVDFYANAGYNQPGCAGKKYCDHRRSRDYFYYSIDNWNYDPSIEKHRCIMGYHVNNSCRGEYYPKTPSGAPYRPLKITD